MDEQEFAELAAGAALDALSPADRDAFEAARREHPEWEHLVRADAATAAVLAEAVPETAPPPELRATLLSQLASTPQLPADDSLADDSPAEGAPAAEAPLSTDAPEPTSRRRWTRGLLALAASVVLLVALGVGAAMISAYLNRPAAVIALQQIEDAPDAQSATADVTDGGTATAHWSESVGKVVLVSDTMPPIAQDESFELWFVRDGAAIAAGTFESSTQTTTALLEGTMQPGDTIAVTVEPQGGSPTGQPSSEPIVMIPTS
ncbi:anti-sigma factor [Microbacterium jejuense]|uniref:anti-sigma factor n=1 Tax=Microbacterium jejuense TaxID=1263637 RepID=UPI0031EDC368